MYTKKQPAGKINTLECFRASLKTLCKGEFIQARGSVLRLAENTLVYFRASLKTLWSVLRLGSVLGLLHRRNREVGGVFPPPQKKKIWLMVPLSGWWCPFYKKVSLNYFLTPA